MASGEMPVDEWSDGEIRRKLAELGSPVGPVTETTRKVLIRKLKRLLQLQSNNASTSAKQRKSSVRYSSGEDSQSEGVDMPPPISKAKNLRRKTIGVTELSSVASRSVVSDVSHSGIPERLTRSRKSLGNLLEKSDILDTDSDSDISQSYSVSLTRKNRKSDILDRQSNIRDRVSEESDVSKSPNPIQNKTRTSINFPERTIQHEENDSEQTEEDEEDVVEDEIDDENPPRFRSEFLTRLRDSGKYGSSNSKIEVGARSPYISRLPQRRANSLHENVFLSKFNMKNTYDSKPVDSSKIVDSFMSNSKINSFLTQNKSHVKLCVICGAVIFFIVTVYLLLVANLSLMPSVDVSNTYPICGGPGVKSQMCVEKNSLKTAIDISEVFIPRVLELTTKAYCESSSGDSIEIPTFSEDDALTYLSEKIPSLSRPQLEKSLRDFKILALSNPHWVINIENKGPQDVKSLLFNGVFVARHVDLPIGCYLRLTASKLFKVVMLTLLLVTSGFVIFFGTKLYNRGREGHKLKVYAMVNKILNLLAEHHEQNKLPAYLVVNNCRDELIPPIERDNMKHVWDKAVEFLENNESRVRTEMHSIRGGNVKVWRWLPAEQGHHSPNTSLNSSGGPMLGRLL